MSVEIIKYGNLEKAIQEGNDKAIRTLVLRVTALAKELAPRDFGQLRNSIMGRVEKKDIGFNAESGKVADKTITPRAKGGEGYVGTNLLHGVYNEFGTRYMPAQPYLRPAIAVEANGAKAKKAVKDFQNDAVKKGMAKGPRIKKEFK